MIPPRKSAPWWLPRKTGQSFGLAHYRRFARPAAGTIGIYIDDLMTHPDHRGNGIARALIQQVSAIAGCTDASVVRWITAAGNTTFGLDPRARGTLPGRPGGRSR